MEGIILGSDNFWQRLTVDPAALAAEVCTIDVNDLDTTLQRHAALRAWVTATWEVARSNVADAEWDLTKARAQALMKARGELDSHTGKAKIAEVLRAETELDPRVEEAARRVREAERKSGALKAMTTALEDRKDMLVQIAAKRRKEEADYGRNAT